MRPLWLDYQRPAPGRRRPGLILLAAGALACVVVTADYFAVADELDTAQADIARLRSAAGRARATAAASAASAAARTEGAAAHSAAQWEALFSSLEAAADDSVTLLGLRTGAGDIQISGEAKDFTASADYVERLQSAKGLARPHMTQSELVLDHPRRPVRFALAAQWREAAR